jgi:isoleucyl-tRNA synthetase
VRLLERGFDRLDGLSRIFLTRLYSKASKNFLTKRLNLVKVKDMKQKQVEKIEQTKSPFPAMEEEVLSFWDRGEIFKKSIERPPLNLPLGKGEKYKEYVFYDGPPFITGMPHYATLLPSIVKDAVPRFWTMNGYRVGRVWGWDCHGLPAENKVEQQLGLKNKKDIEALGVGKFVEACRDYVRTGSEQWN